MNFFQKLISAGPQVGNYEAIGQVWLKNYNSKWAKKYRQNGSSVDDTRSPRVNVAKKIKLTWKRLFFSNFLNTEPLISIKLLDIMISSSTLLWLLKATFSVVALLKGSILFSEHN